METNLSLEQKGLGNHEKEAYWTVLVSASASNKADPTRADIKAAYDQAIADCTTIINRANPTTAELIWAVKRLAEMVRDDYKYHRAEIKDAQ